jgi:hypothetical protein
MKVTAPTLTDAVARVAATLRVAGVEEATVLAFEETTVLLREGRDDPSVSPQDAAEFRAAKARHRERLGRGQGSQG